MYPRALFLPPACAGLGASVTRLAGLLIVGSRVPAASRPGAPASPNAVRLSGCG